MICYGSLNNKSGCEYVFVMNIFQRFTHLSSSSTQNVFNCEISIKDKNVMTQHLLFLLDTETNLINFLQISKMMSLLQYMSDVSCETIL